MQKQNMASSLLGSWAMLAFFGLLVILKSPLVFNLQHM